MGDVNNTRLPEGYVCNICNIAGHWRSKCQSDEAKRLRERYQAGHKKRAMIAREVIESDTSNSVISSLKSSLPEAKDYAMFTKVNPKSYVGYFDTGASKTILGMKTAFSNLQLLDKPVTFQTAQDSTETLSATHGGTAILKIQGITMIYEGAVYIEGSPNLIALGYITRSCGQYSAELNDGVLVISPKDNMNKKTDTIRVVAEQDVFPVEFEAIGSTYTEQAYFASPRTTFNGMSVEERNHYRGSCVKGLYASYELPDLNPDECDLCRIGCSQAVKGKDEGRRIPTRVLQYVVMDCAGPFDPPDIYGRRYAVIVKDLYTGYRMPGIFLYTTGEWAKEVDKRLAEATTFHNSVVQHIDVEKKSEPIRLAVIRTDGDGAMNANEVAEKFKDRGVRHERIAPRHHYQAGAMEQPIGPQTRRVVSTLKHGNVPHAFWSFAWAYVTYVSNLKPNKDGISPHQAWFNMKIDNPKLILSRLRVMFCLAFPHISNETRTKLDIRSLACVNLGICDWAGYKGYFFLTLEKGTVIIAESASFNESVFPFRDERVWAHFNIPWNEYKHPFSAVDETEACGARVWRNADVDKCSDDLKLPPHILKPTVHLNITEAMVFSDDVLNAEQQLIDDGKLPRDKRAVLRSHGIPILPPTFTYNVPQDQL